MNSECELLEKEDANEMIDFLSERIHHLAPAGRALLKWRSEGYPRTLDNDLFATLADAVSGAAKASKTGSLWCDGDDPEEDDDAVSQLN